MSKVCIITPAYKSKALFEKISLPSVQSQTFTDWTHYIVHDGPEKDETAEYIASLNDPRIIYDKVPRVIPEPPNGRRFMQGNPYHAVCGFNCTNHARKRIEEEQADCEYICHIDHDDAWSKDHLEVMVRSLDALTERYMAWSMAIIYKKNYFNRYAGIPYNRHAIFHGTMGGPAWSSIFYRRKGPYDKFFAGNPGHCSDWDWLKKFLLSTKKSAWFVPHLTTFVFHNCRLDWAEGILQQLKVGIDLR